jgi:putative hydrolase of the HAD superfamily
MEALDLDRFFDAIVFTDDLGREAWKPSPEPFVIIADRLGIRAPEAVYIADNPLKDFLGPRSLGMRTIRIRFEGGYHAHDEPPTPQHAPDISLSDLGGLEGALLIADEKESGA